MQGLPILACNFSVDGKFVVSADEGGNVRLWHIEAVKQVCMYVCICVHVMASKRCLHNVISAQCSEWVYVDLCDCIYVCMYVCMYGMYVCVHVGVRGFV